MAVDPLDLTIAEALAADLGDTPSLLLREITDLNGRFFAPPTTTIDAGATGSVQQAIAGNPARYCLIFGNLSANQILVGIDGQTSPTQDAIPLAAGTFWRLNYREVAVLVTRTWYCYAAVSPSWLTIHEVIVV